MRGGEKSGDPVPGQGISRGLRRERPGNQRNFQSGTAFPVVPAPVEDLQAQAPAPVGKELVAEFNARIEFRQGRQVGGQEVAEAGRKGPVLGLVTGEGNRHARAVEGGVGGEGGQGKQQGGAG